MEDEKPPTEFKKIEVTNRLGTTPEDLYAEHWRAATAVELASAAVKSTEAPIFKQYETKRVAIAEQRYDSNIKRATAHLQHNQAAYYDQALADAQAADVEIKQ